MRLIIISLVLLLSACGKPGPQGQPGQSIVGPPGPTGSPGPSGTIITMKQLCGSCVPTYPSVFAESVMCIDNQLYGVYSANGGFLSLLTPGTYTSNGINCSCTITIGNDCSIS